MLPIQEKILLYFDLPEDEQVEVRLAVRGNPELETLFAESQALHTVLSPGSERAVQNTAALTDYVLFSALKAGDPPAGVAAHYARIESLVGENPELRARVEAIRLTLERFTATAEDPIARFDQLTARSPQPAEVPAPDREAIVPRRNMRLLVPIRYALAACVALVTIYAALSIFSWRFQSDRTRLTALHATEEAFVELTLRGEPTEPTADALDESLELLRNARTSTLGLFPSYDAERLEAAAALAEGFAADGEATAMRTLRAQYVLGKIRMYQERDAEAAEALQKVVDGRGEGAEDARRLLDYIRTRGPSDLGIR